MKLNWASLLLRSRDHYTVSIEPPKSEGRKSPSALVLLAVTLAKIPTAWHMLAVVFIGTPPPPGKYYCDSPFAPGTVTTIAKTIKRDSWTWDGNCPSISNFSTECVWITKTRPEFFSISVQWGLVCERAVLVPTTQTGYLLGILLGGALCFKLIPRCGARRLLLLGLSCQPLLGVALAFCPYYIGHFLIKFFIAVASAFVLTSAVSFCEGVSRYVCLIEIGWSLGVLTIAGMCAIAPEIDILGEDWRKLYLVLAALSSVPLILCSSILPEIIQVGSNSGTGAVPEEPQKSTLRLRDLVYKSILHCLWGVVTISFFGGLLNARNLVRSNDVEDVATIAAAAAGAEIIGFLLGTLLLRLPRRQRFTWLGATLLVGGALCTASGVVIYTSPHYAKHDYGALILPTGALTLRVPVAASLGILPSLTDKQQLFTCLIAARTFLQVAPFIAFLGIFGSNVAVGSFGLVGLSAGLFAVVLAILGNSKATEKSASKSTNGRPII